MHTGENEGAVGAEGRGALEYWEKKKLNRCSLLFLLLVFGMLSTFITLLHLVYSLCPPLLPPPHAVFLLLLPSSTLQEH